MRATGTVGNRITWDFSNATINGGGKSSFILGDNG